VRPVAHARGRQHRSGAPRRRSRRPSAAWTEQPSPRSDWRRANAADDDAIVATCTTRVRTSEGGITHERGGAADRRQLFWAANDEKGADQNRSRRTLNHGVVGSGGCTVGWCEAAVRRVLTTSPDSERAP